jgi:hypothetical protein
VNKVPKIFTLRSYAHLVIAVALLCAPAVSAAQSLGGNPIAAPTGEFRVAGSIVNKIGGEPLAGARVILTEARNPQSTQSMVTADDGRFLFQARAGKYSLSAEKQGFLTTFYKGHEQFSTAIVTGAGYDTESLVIRLARYAVLSGRVLDESGEPVRNATVTVYIEDRRSGVGLIHPTRQSTTDDQGAYEATPLGDGTYFAAVRAQPWYAVHPFSHGGEATPISMIEPGLDVAYPITYYGDATESDEATPIPIRGGDRIEADIHLGPVPAVHLVVHVSGDASHGMVMPMLQKQSFDSMVPVQNGRGAMVSPGVFEMTGIPPGRYTIREVGSAEGQVSEPSEYDVNSNTTELDMSSARPTSTLKAKVLVVGESKLPLPLTVAMRNSKGRVVAGDQVSSEGEATFSHVSAGEYTFVAGSPTKPYSVKITSTSGVTGGRKLNVPPGSSLDIALALVGGELTVEGVAQRDGKPFAGAMVVLVPKDPESNRELFRRDQSDQDGTFSLLQVVPGSYTVIAIEDGWDLDWGKPAVLAQYTKHGQSVSVASQAKRSVKLTDAVDVQKK